MSNSFDHISAVAVNAGKNEDYSYTYALILAGIIDANHDIDDDDTIIETLDTIAKKVSNDFTIDFDGNEYRIINTDSIWDIYVEEIKNIVTDCYDLKLDKIPDFIAVTIDWEQTAGNTYADGYGHTFSSYDGEEIEIIGNSGVIYHAFRTN